MAERAHRRQCAAYARREPFSAVEAAVGAQVVRGPFAGLRYPRGRVASLSKRLGSYERELHGWLEDALAAAPARFVDVGAADGFYAVGVARRGVPVDAFELARTARAQVHELAALNAVRVAISGRATAASLAPIDFTEALVLCDCEGAELELLTPALIERLTTATVIVEAHESVRPGAERVLRERFAASHDVDVVQPSDRDAADFPELSLLEPNQRRAALGIGRTGYTPWLRALPKR
jgi:hypothetical protein